MPNFTTTADGYKFIQDRLDTHEWWLIPVVTLDAVMFPKEVVERFYADDNGVLLDVVRVQQPIPTIRFLPLVLASKSCMSLAQLERLVGNELSNGDLVVHASTPIGVLRWLAMHLTFYSQVDVGSRRRGR